MDGFQVGQVVVGDVDADAEIKASVTPVNDLKVAELEREKERREDGGNDRGKRGGMGDFGVKKGRFGGRPRRSWCAWHRAR